MPYQRYRLEDQSWYGPIPPIEATEAVDEAPADVVLLTAVEEELNAVLRLLKPFPGVQAIWQVSQDRETYYLGQFGRYRSVVTMCEMGASGPASAGLATNQAIQIWLPKAVIMVGFAFGASREGQKIGDVLVSSQVINYPKQRVGKRIIYRGPRPESGVTLRNRFRNSIGWLFESPGGSRSTRRLGPILSGEVLIDNLTYKKRLLKQFPDAIGGEMEGVGVYAAAERSGVEWIIVKAICDWADGRKDKVKRHQPLAAAAAASLVHHVLSLPNALPTRNAVGQPPRRHRSNGGKAVDRPRPFAAIRQACFRLTERRAKVLTNNWAIIPRHDFRGKLNEFLDLPVRYCILVGPSGVGKSVAMAVEALRLFDSGWTTILMAAGEFSVERAHKRICQEMAAPRPARAFGDLVRSLLEQDTSTPARLAIFIDGIDDANPNRLASEMSKLHDTIGDLPTDAVKVVISCNDASWERLRVNPAMPTYEQVETLGRLGTGGSVSVEMSDFAVAELDSALEEIGAQELLLTKHFERQADYHVLSLRELLKHPAIFGHYAALKRSGDQSRIQDLTWSVLVEGSIRQALREASNRCDVPPEDLHAHLVQFAQSTWEAKAWGFTLERGCLKAKLPDLFRRRRGARLSPYSALIRTGTIVEMHAPVGGPTAAFRVSDAGSYFLSIELEQRAADKPIEEFRKLAEEWLQEAWNYAPLLDALLALVDRMADIRYDPRLLALIECVISGYHFQSGSLFRVVRPIIIASIFEIVKRRDLPDFYAFKEAARELRYSVETIGIIRDHLKDPDPRVRQIAVELVGIHGDIDSNQELLDLSGDSDEEVRREVYSAVRRLGRPAIPTLIEKAGDTSNTPQRRGFCLAALRGVAYRDDRIGPLIEQCLTNPASGDPNLLEQAFLLAAHLRAKGHTPAAIASLKHESLDVVQAAAKYLTEVPDPQAFAALEAALNPKFSSSGEKVQRYWVPRQLVAALGRSDPQKAGPVIYALFSRAFAGKAEFSAAEAARAAKKLRFPALYGLILQQVTFHLRSASSGEIPHWVVDATEDVWREVDLGALVATSVDLATQGVNVAQLFASAVSSGMEISQGYRLGGRLSRVSDLNTAIKCQAEDLAPEVATLLNRAGPWNVNDLSRLLWLYGDAGAESALLRRLENPVSQAKTVWYERSNVARALGTCGTRRSWGAIQELLCTEENVSRYLDSEGLYPLLLRRVIGPGDLVAIARDAKYSGPGRILCLLALAHLSVRRYKALFHEAAVNAENELLQMYGARLVGFAGDPSLAPTLLGLLRTSKYASVRSQAVEALGRLRISQAVHDIEHALQDCPASAPIRALGSLRAPSSLTLILEGVKDWRGAFYRDYLETLCAFWRFPKAREAIEAQLTDWAHNKPVLFDDQTPLLAGLLRHQPGEILGRAGWLIDNGAMKSGAREQLARSLPSLAKNGDIDKSELKNVIRKLLTDPRVMVRELTIQGLHAAGNRFCRQLYGDVTRSSTRSDPLCAVRLMGIVGDVERLECARYDREFLVRRAADQALDAMLKRVELEKHIDHFTKEGGPARMSAFVCLEEHGDLSSLKSLQHKCRKGSLSFSYVRSLTSSIRTRLEKEQRDKQDEEDKLEESSGAVWFD
jgi:nucleoside phosphorylase/HEAT repeat protein